MLEIANKIITCFKRGNKILICGNGGSAAMASHMAAEFVNKFEHHRKALPAIALTVDISVLTSIANDSGYLYIFSRQIDALGNPGDILLIFTTTKNLGETFHSMNIVEATKMAEVKQMEIIYIPIIGKTIARIQEYQFKLMHDICREVEREFL